MRWRYINIHQQQGGWQGGWRAACPSSPPSSFPLLLISSLPPSAAVLSLPASVARLQVDRQRRSSSATAAAARPAAAAAGQGRRWPCSSWAGVAHVLGFARQAWEEGAARGWHSHIKTAAPPVATLGPRPGACAASHASVRYITLHQAHTVAGLWLVCGRAVAADTVALYQHTSTTGGLLRCSVWVACGGTGVRQGEGATSAYINPITPTA